jgi:hypothetical protein
VWGSEFTTKAATLQKAVQQKSCPAFVYADLGLVAVNITKGLQKFEQHPMLRSRDAARGLKCLRSETAPCIAYMNEASKLGLHTQTNRGTCPGAGL